MKILHDPKAISEREGEEAAYAYVMSLMTVMVGLPFPILNLIGCVGYFLLIRSKSKFVRFHAFQAMSSQAVLILLNTTGIIWTIKVVFYEAPFTNLYLGYLITVIGFNLTDYIFNIIAAIKAKKGEIYMFMFFGALSFLIYFGNRNSTYESESVPAIS